MKLLGDTAVDLRVFDVTRELRGSDRFHARGPQSQEPIHVHVRVRPYTEVLPDTAPAGRSIRSARASHPGPDRRPVGTMLDCYL